MRIKAVLATAILAVIIGLGLLANASAAPNAAPTPDQAKAWLQDQQAAQQADLTDWQAYRARLDAPDDGDPLTDTGVVREARVGCQDALQIVLHRTDLTAGARADVNSAYEYLCGPDGGEPNPALWSLAKRLHIANREFGSDGERKLTRHLNATTDELALYP